MNFIQKTLCMSFLLLFSATAMAMDNDQNQNPNQREDGFRTPSPEPRIEDLTPDELGRLYEEINRRDADRRNEARRNARRNNEIQPLNLNFAFQIIAADQENQNNFANRRDHLDRQ